VSEDKEYTQDELSNMMRGDLFRIAVKKGMSRAEYYNQPFDQMVQWVYDHQNDPDVDPEAKPADKPAAKPKSGGVKNKGKDAKPKAAPRGRGGRTQVKGDKEGEGSAVSADLGPLQKRVDANADNLAALQETVETFAKANGDNFIDSIESTNELRSDVWVVKELVTRVYKLFENPDGVDRIVSELEAQCQSGDEDPE